MTKVFTSGMIVKRALPNAPKWVKAKLSFKVAEFIEFLKKHDNNGWVNVDILESQDGAKLYGALNDYKKVDAPVVADEPPADEINANEIPF